MRYIVATLAALAATAIAAPTATVFPSAASSTSLSAAKVISGTFDGKMVRYSRSRMSP